MERFQNVLSKFGFNRGGSSDEADVPRRSTQSTPRMSRSRVREFNDGSQNNPHNGAQFQHKQTNPVQQQVFNNHLQQQRQHQNQGHHQGNNLQHVRPFGSMGSMEIHRVNRVRERSWESDRVHRVDQPQTLTHEQAQALNRSWDIDKVPGLDRNWQVEQARGLELVYRSMEKEKERRLQLAQNQSQGNWQQPQQKEAKKKKRKRDKSKESQAMMEQIDNNKLSQERLERRIDELNRMLLEEKHQNRKDKLAVAKLQQEVARQKSDRSIRATKELERERMLRLDAEKRLRDTVIKSDHNNARLVALQEEFKKMEDVARTMLQFKNKVDHLKQEKATLSINYEKSVQKLRTESGNLEHENKIVTAELKRLESQCNNCQHCNKDLSYRVTKIEPGQSESSDKVKMLLERLKRLEEEKSQLVLENENQREQYEKCLDEIANQVVQALLSQKGLREECSKLRQRVIDLEDQNRQLKDMFHHRMRFASDSLLQAMSSRGGVHSDQNLEQAANKVMLHGGALTGSCDSITPLSQISLGSLQSIYSNYHENSHICGSDPGKPAPSSPPSWLKDMVMKTDSPSSSICSPSTIDTILSLKTGSGPVTSSTPGVATKDSIDQHRYIPDSKGKQQPQQKDAGFNRIISHSETESAFHTVIPGSSAQVLGSVSGNNQIPACDQAHLQRMHVQNMAMQHHRHNSSQQLSNTVVPCQTASTQATVSQQKSCENLDTVVISKQLVSDVDLQLINSIQNAKKRFSQGLTIGEQMSGDYQIETEFPADNTSPKMKHTDKNMGVKLQQKCSVTDNDENHCVSRPVYITHTPDTVGAKLVRTDSGSVSPGTQLLNMSDDKFALADDLLVEQHLSSNYNDDGKLNEFLDSEDDSDDSSTSRPLSNNLSMASTLSLNELLEKGLDNKSNCDLSNYAGGIGLDDFEIFGSEEEGDFKDPIDRMKMTFGKLKSGGENSNAEKNPSVNTAGKGYLAVSNKRKETSEKDYGDYVCLSKIREYMYMNMPEIREKQLQHEKQLQKESNKSWGAEHDEKQLPVKSNSQSNSQTSSTLQIQPIESDYVYLSNKAMSSNERLHNKDKCKKTTKSTSQSNKRYTPVKNKLNSVQSEMKKSFEDIEKGNTNSCELLGENEPKVGAEDSNVALKSSYHDYVNLSPEMVKEILSSESSTSWKQGTQHREDSYSNKKPKVSQKQRPGNIVGNEHLAAASSVKNVASPASPNVSKQYSLVVAPYLLAADEDENLSRSTTHCNHSAESDKENHTCNKVCKSSENCTGSGNSTLQSSYTSTNSSENRLSLDPLKHHSSSQCVNKDEGYSSNSANSGSTPDMLSPDHDSKKPALVDNLNFNNNSSIDLRDQHHDDNDDQHLDWQIKEVKAHQPFSGLSSCIGVKNVDDYSSKHTVLGVRVSGDKFQCQQAREKKSDIERFDTKTRSPFPDCGTVQSIESGKKNPASRHNSNSLIPKPCLIKHVIRRCHSTTCIIKMEKLEQNKIFYIHKRYSSLNSLINHKLSQNKEFQNMSFHRSLNRTIDNQQSPPSNTEANSQYSGCDNKKEAVGHYLKRHSEMYKPKMVGIKRLNMLKEELGNEDRRITGEGCEAGYLSGEDRQFTQHDRDVQASYQEERHVAEKVNILCEE